MVRLARLLCRSALLCLAFFSGVMWAQPGTDNTSGTFTVATDDNAVFLETSVSKNTVYVQESLIFSIKLYYTLALERGAAFSRLEMSDAAYNKLGDDINYTETVNGIDYSVNESRFVIFPQVSGQFTIDPIRFRAYTQTRATRRNTNLQTTAQRQRIELVSPSHQISVLPVPNSFPGPNWLPSSAIELSENWTPSLEDLKIGDSVVRTVALSVEGLYAAMLTNLNFTFDSSMRHYPAEAQQVDFTEHSGVRSEHTQNITLVATEAGKMTLPEVSIPWWNTLTDSLEYATLPAQELDILTVDGRQIQTDPAGQQSDASDVTFISGFLSAINLNLLLFVSVIFVVAVLFFAPALSIVGHKLLNAISIEFNRKPTRALAKTAEIDLSYNKLKQACAQKNIQTAAEYFLSWGQAYFQDLSLYSLNKLAQSFKHDALSNQIRNLQNYLYAEGPKADFEFDVFIEIVTVLHQNRKTRRVKKLPYNLPPLYKN